MADPRDSHVVEITAAADRHPPDPAATAAAMRHHPLAEISGSPGHLLLLKLWQREEDLVGRRIGAHEARLDGAKAESFQLCSLFFAFHGLSLALLFAAAAGRRREACVKWWVPCCVPVVTSLVLIGSVQRKVCGYWRVWRKLQREREEGRALAGCVQELRMKGASFDLSKEPRAARRMKSSSVEVRWGILRWGSRNAVAVGLLCFAGLAFPASKFVLCGG